MKITLTYVEGRVLTRRLPEPIARRLIEGRRNSWNQSHIYLFPPVGWRWILDHLRVEAYGTRGGKKYQADSLYTAIAKITEAVKMWELHPAFAKIAWYGISAEIVPAFHNDGGLSPYPPGEFVLLAPAHITQQGHKLTVWKPVDWLPGEDPLHREDFHLGVWREIVELGAELGRIPQD